MYVQNINVDILVVFGSGVEGGGVNARAKYRLIEEAAEKQIPVIQLEEGWIKRGEYWSVSVNGLPKKGDYTHENIDRSRIDKITEWTPFHQRKGKILIVGQVPWDQTVKMSNKQFARWVNNAWNNLQRFGTVMYRPHPRFNKNLTPLDEELNSTAIVYTYSSTTAVDAILRGIPVRVKSPEFIVSELSVDENLGNIPDEETQRRVLNEVANAQWTVKEMEDGRCWEHVKQLKTIKEYKS
jgi:capsule polysaccharide export protein KpsC/LpsZ